MDLGSLSRFFEEFMAKEPLFVYKEALQQNYSPLEVFHREEQINQVANALAPVLRLERPSNILIYGKTGTGKTLTVRKVTEEIMRISKQKGKPIKTIYLNCKLKKTADTEYRLIAKLAAEFGRDIPSTGLPTEEVYRLFFDALEKETRILILVLDEIDYLVKKAGDGLLYSLTRINSELKNTQITIVGISNDLLFVDNLDPRVKSSLSEEGFVFPPYNAIQLQGILRQRANEAFISGALEEGAIEKCAAYAAKEHGDARRAIDLLRVAGEIAERQGQKKVTTTHIDLAEEKIDRDNIIEIITTQPKQFQAALYAITTQCTGGKKASTGEIYSAYAKICPQAALRPLTQRRVSGIISEFDMLGIINAETISKGRYGKTREVSISPPASANPQINLILRSGLELT